MSATTSPPTREGLPPGPRGRLVTGSLHDFARERLDFFVRIAREYGDLSHFRVGPRRMFLANHPDLIEQVLVTDARHYHKHFGAKLYMPVLGEGLVTSEGDFWLRQRRLSQPAFHRKKIEGYSRVMVELAERHGSAWVPGSRADMHQLFSHLTSVIALKTLFGLEEEGDRAAFTGALRETFELLSQRFRRLIQPPSWLPTPYNFRLKRGIRTLDAVIHSYIRKARERTEPGDDLLSALVRATDDGGGRMTDRQLRDEAMTLYLAGHETTALTLTWTWFLLARHPDVATGLLAEWDAVLGGRPATVEDVPRLPFTGHVITESMRVLPPVYLIGREATRDLELGGYRVRRGTTVFLSQWVTHRDPRWFDDPLEFRPSRWADGLAGRIPKYAYFPFGGGPRVCIGNHFAMIEAVLLLATVGRRWRFSVDADYEVRYSPSITLLPEGGVWATLEAR